MFIILAELEIIFAEATISYFWVLHPVARIIKVILLLTATLVLLLPLHVSALVGHLQVEYTIVPTTDPL
jgi:hypothetical protein